MNRLDRRLQDWRIARARPWIPAGARVLDVGCHDGALFRSLGPALGEGLGLDPDLPGPVDGERFRLVPGSFPGDAPREAASFDAIAMLAVLEHVPPTDLAPVAAAAHRLLRPGGRLVLTVPSPKVDTILAVLMRLRLLDGMEAEQHHGFDPADVEPLMTAASLTLREHHRFQLGLNHLFVFERPPDAPA